jgi:hypothetical protein
MPLNYEDLGMIGHSSAYFGAGAGSIRRREGRTTSSSYAWVERTLDFASTKFRCEWKPGRANVGRRRLILGSGVNGDRLFSAQNRLALHLSVEPGESERAAVSASRARQDEQHPG